MDLCLDTNGYSAMMRGHKEVQDLIEKADSVIIPAVVLGELHAGFSLGSKRQANTRQLHSFLAAPGIRIAEITQSTAEQYGKIVRHLKLQGTPMATNDIWIAAIAFETGTVVLSADSHFSVVPMLDTVHFS